MPALAKDLMPLGIPDQAALRLGYQLATVATAGTTKDDATVLLKSQTLVSLTSTGASEGVKLPADAELGVPYVLGNTSSNALLLYPPASGQINGDTASTGTVPITARGTTIAYRTATNAWLAVVGAAG